MLKKLIIGKNSNIVKKIASRIHGCDYISHADVKMFDFSTYDVVCVFSWSYKNNDENIEIIQSIPRNKIVFISTTAVLSLDYRRSQYSMYPNNKKICEELVLSGDGIVVRIGVVDEEISKKINGAHPFTEIQKIVDFINTLPSSCAGKIIDLFDIKVGRPAFLTRFISKVYGYMCGNKKSSKGFSVLFILLMKMIKNPNYGYTYDSNQYFTDEIIVGFGAIGSEYYKQKKEKRFLKVMICGKDDIVLREKGFSLFRIGYSYTGLSKYWHGVSVRSKGLGNFKKYVPLFIKRPKPPKTSIKCCIESFDVSDHKIVLNVISGEHKKEKYYTNKIILAAGALENTKILSEYLNINAKISDHELGYIGTVSLSEAIKNGLIKELGPLIIHKKYIRGWLNKSHYIIDARPYVKEKVNSLESQAFYVEQTLNIIKKIIKNLSIARLNEAIFNKFGFGVKTRKISLFAQLEAVNAIEYTVGIGFERKRIDLIWDSLFDTLGNVYKTFEKVDCFISVDGLHPTGAAEIIQNKEMCSLIENQRIVILGSPTINRLYGVHNTDRLIKVAKKKAQL
jgi:hypothetical protein